MSRFLLVAGIFAATVTAGCGRATEPVSEGSGQSPAQAAAATLPPTPASARIIGEWEVTAVAPSGPVRLGLRFTENSLARYSSGRMTAELRARVVEETEDSVVIELGEGSGEGSGEPLVERYRLVGDDGLVHEAVPELVFRRGPIAPHGPEPVLPDDTAEASGGAVEPAPTAGSGPASGSGAEAGSAG